MNVKRTRVGVDLLRRLVEEGVPIFTLAEARSLAADVGMGQDYVVEALYHLRKAGWIRLVKRGVYAITEESGFANPPHDYAIALALVSPAAISHWTALYHHHLTQQIPQTVFVLTPTGTYVPRRALEGTPYQVVQIKPDKFFGFASEWVDHSRVLITDPERTLVDGLISPQYCGGIQEVIGAFRARGTELEVGKVVDYACRMEGPVVSRLGWVLESFGYSGPEVDRLWHSKPNGVRNLDASGSGFGPIDERWRLRYNLGGEG